MHDIKLLVIFSVLRSAASLYRKENLKILQTDSQILRVMYVCVYINVQDINSISN